MTKRILVLLTVVALMMVMLAMAIGPAFALPDNLSGKQQTGGSRNRNNCVGYFDAQVIHNGSEVRNQDRKAEVERLQNTCNNANQK
jgi:hypothetical protein